MRTLLAAPLLLSLATAPNAQDICEGNGQGASYLTTTAAVIGGDLVIRVGSPNAPFGLAFLQLSSGLGPSDLGPLLGTVCIDVAAPISSLATIPLNANGELVATISIDSGVGQVLFPPLYLMAVVLDGSVSIPKTVRLTWHNPDGSLPTGPLAEGRFLHTATLLEDDPLGNRQAVLIAGGGGGDLLTPTTTDTTEIFDPLTRTFSAGPSLSVARTALQDVLLDDGRALLTGGVLATGVTSAVCELYDHDNGTMTPTGSLQAARSEHRITKLDDGRVLATGGLADFQGAGTDILPPFNSVMDSAEIYDPQTGTWTTLTSTLATARAGHGQSLLPDGRVILVGGLSGAVISAAGPAVPTYTESCEIFDPQTDTFSTTFNLLGARGFHGQSVLGDGRLLVTGGATSDTFFGTLGGTASCVTFTEATGWLPTGFLSALVGYHRQVTLPSGEALLTGGLIGNADSFDGSALVGTHDGVIFTPRSDLGTDPGLAGALPSPRGLHRATPLADGTLLITGGWDGTTPLAGGFVYQP